MQPKSSAASRVTKQTASWENLGSRLKMADVRAEAVAWNCRHDAEGV